MAIETQKYIRKPLYVEAVRVTADNFDELVPWCKGEVQRDEVPGQGTGKPYIRVKVNSPKVPRQTKAFVGDWILYTPRGYKIYTNKAFHALFNPVPPEEETPVGPNPLQESLETDVVAPPPTPAIIPPQDGNTVIQTPGEQYADAVRGEINGSKPEKVAPAAVEGKRVLSKQEQREMSSDEVRELLQSGQAVLAQDIAQP